MHQRGERLTRGVWRAPYLLKGWPALIAIDRAGDFRKHLPIRHPEDEERLTRALEGYLDVVDPPLGVV